MLAAALAVLAFTHGNAIYSMSADGSGVHRLTAGGEPAYSPSGDMLAFTRAPNEDRSEIWVSAPDGSGARRLVGAGRGYDGVGSPAWSPDGSMLAFSHYTVSEKHGLRSSIEVVDRDGRGRRTVVSVDPRALEAAYEPTWTPDGRRLLYTRTRATGAGDYVFELRSVGADGSGDALFLRDAASAAFSPDGTRVAFSDSSTHNGDTCGSDECYPNGELAVAGADGSGRRILFESESDEGTPSWSPDGARIAFASGRNVPTRENGGAEVYTIAPDGSCLTWLTNGDRDSGDPAWAPGATAAPGCGTGRPARHEQRAPRRGTWWLGRDFGAAMLSTADRETVDYGDCSAFDPRDCPPPFSLHERDMCHGGPAQRGFVQALTHFRRARGALTATLDRGDSVSLVVLTGRSAITVDLQTSITSKARRALFGRIVAGLRRAGFAHRSKLAPPRVDTSLRRLLTASVAVC
jgi:dipeptidyl aminopeptidase/acylaminoacyl peptidase